MRRAVLAVLALIWAAPAWADPIPYAREDSIAVLDPQAPDDVARALWMNGVTGELKIDELDTPYFVGEVLGAPMIAAFFNCNVELSRCRRVLYETEVDQGAASDAAVTAWSVANPSCGTDILAPGRVWIWRLARLSARDSGVEVMAEQQAWRACVEGFRQAAGSAEGGAASGSPPQN